MADQRYESIASGRRVRGYPRRPIGHPARLGHHEQHLWTDTSDTSISCSTSSDETSGSVDSIGVSRLDNVLTKRKQLIQTEHTEISSPTTPTCHSSGRLQSLHVAVDECCPIRHSVLHLERKGQVYS